MKLIGTGSFTKAYLKSRTRVFLISSCPIKECMAQGYFPNSYLFPKIKQLDHEQYEMPLYEQPKSLKESLLPKQWDIYAMLRELFTYNAPDQFNYSTWYEKFQELPNKYVSNVLCEALDACANYTDKIGFEISPRNVAVKNGKLVLLDCFYSIDKLMEVRRGS